MMSVGSHVASSSGAGSSGGPLACAWVSLTLEEQLANVNRIVRKHPIHQLLDVESLEFVARVVKELRNDPWVDIGNLLPPYQRPFGVFFQATPLHWAVLMDDRTMVQYILTSRRIDIDASTGYRKETALHYAIVGENHDIVEDLLQHKADVCMCNSSSESALYYMVHHKDSMFDILKTILANNVNMCDEAKNTALHYAAREGTVDVVRYLLDEKANVDLRNKFGCTPLHYAAKKRSLDVVAHLLQQKAKVNMLDENGWSPLHFAAREGAINIITLLVQHNAIVDALNESGQSPLLVSISSQNIDASKELIAIGANVDVKDKGDNNALHLAIRAHDNRKDNMVDHVKLLHKRDVDANAKNSRGYSPFFIAVADGHIEVVKELLRSKEKIELMEECNGETAIQIAFDNGHEHIKRALLECDDVSRYVGDLYRDRQVYVDAANAILVGAALIASVTFASWLQPPLGYTTSYLDLAPSSSNINYVDVQDNVPLRAFWVFNTLSFYFAIGTVVFGARSVLPRQQMFIKAIVVKLHHNLLVTSILLACSVFFVLIAFGIAGCIVLTPTLKFQWYMIVPTIFGGLVCLVSLGFLFKSMVEDNLKKQRVVFRVYY